MKKVFNGLKDWAMNHKYIAAGILVFITLAIVGTYTTR